jgi:hypothetical protein
MGALRWTGKAFTLAGKIMTSEAFEDWLKAEGQQILEKKMHDIGLSFLLGRTRARWKLQGDIRGLDELGDAFRSALVARLDTLPKHIGDVARSLDKDDFPELIETKTLDWIIAVPRRAAVRRYKEFVRAELANAAALQNYPGLADTLLNTRSGEAEELFFESLRSTKTYISDSRYEVVLGVDPTTNWGSDIHGHYYVARSYVGRPDLTEKKNLKSFVDAFQSMKKSLEDRIGAMSRPVHERIVTAMNDHTF